MLVELGAVEQRYRAVLEVLEEGVSVTEVARRCGVVRQTVHGWLRRKSAIAFASGPRCVRLCASRPHRRQPPQPCLMLA